MNMNSKDLKAVLKTLGACERGIVAVGDMDLAAAWAAASQEDREWLVQQIPALAPLLAKYDADTAPLWDKYDADAAPLRDKYQSDADALRAKYWADKNALCAKYADDVDALLAKYPADRDALWAKYRADTAPLWAAIFPLEVVESALAAM